MARLNEPPAVGESVEALKRRFIRQNREIARANSTQSLRIRTLEAETSRLLSENITLREENIKLRHELDQGQSRLALDNVGAIKEKLEAKLVELCNMVADLGKTPPEISPLQKRASRRTSRRSIAERNWRGTMSLTEAMAEGRLPPIVEGKYYPRKTLDSEELHAILSDPANVTDSPELGPPPVAHFDGGDPVKHDSIDTYPSNSPSKGRNGHLSEHGALTEDHFANLETRRKRREGVSNEEKDHGALNGSTPISKDALTSVSEQPLRVGAKRKLSARESDELGGSISSNKDDFTFNRRASTTNKDSKGRNRSHEVLVTRSSRDGPKENPRELLKTTSTRKALCEKNVNTDPMTSPAKSKAGDGDMLKESQKDLPRKSRASDKVREKPSAIKVVRSSVLPTNSEPTPIPPSDLPPITPAPPDLDIISPPSSEPTNMRPESRDTPPPTDLASDPTNATCRPSRRQRATVSYAEPSLRDKMRRPTKDLVDAVSSDVKIMRVQAAKPTDDHHGGRGSLDGENSVPSAQIKQEEDEDSQMPWKSLPSNNSRHRPEPTSPLGNKISSAGTDADLPSTVLTDRRRRSSMLLQQQPTTSDNPDPDSGSTKPITFSSTSSNPSSAPTATSSSNTTIAALVAGSQKRLSRAREAASAAAVASRSQRQQHSSNNNLSLSDNRERNKELERDREAQFGKEREKETQKDKDVFEFTGSELDLDGDGGAAVASGKEVRRGAGAAGSGGSGGRTLRRVSSLERGGSESGGSRRRETMGSAATITATANSAAVAGDGIDTDAGDGIVVNDKRTVGGALGDGSGGARATRGVGEDTLRVSRVERAAVRRRSMLL